MANKVNWQVFQSVLHKKGLSLFTPLEMQRVLKITPIAARFLVHRYSKKGLLIKLRNGLYAFADRPPSDFAIANRLYEPSYISFEFALSYYHLIPEIPYGVSSATTRPTRSFDVQGKTFHYHRVQRGVFCGYEPARIEGSTVLIATPEKAWVDFLYFVDLKKKELNERLSSRDLSWKKILSYLQLYRRPSLVRLAEKLR